MTFEKRAEEYADPDTSAYKRICLSSVSFLLLCTVVTGSLQSEEEEGEEEKIREVTRRTANRQLLYHITFAVSFLSLSLSPVVLAFEETTNRI